MAGLIATLLNDYSKRYILLNYWDTKYLQFPLIYYKGLPDILRELKILSVQYRFRYDIHGRA